MVKQTKCHVSQSQPVVNIRSRRYGSGSRAPEPLMLRRLSVCARPKLTEQVQPRPPTTVAVWLGVGIWAHGARKHRLNRGCGAQLAFVSFLIGISEVAAGPGCPTAHSTTAVAPDVPQNGKRTDLPCRRHLSRGARDHALDRGCGAQLVAVSFLIGVPEVGAAPGRPSAPSTAAVAPDVAQNG